MFLDCNFCFSLQSVENGSLCVCEIENGFANPVHLGQESELSLAIVFPGTRDNMCVHTMVFTCCGGQVFTFDEV